MKTKSQHNSTPRPRFRAMRKAATAFVGPLVAVAAMTLAACNDDDINSSTIAAVTPATVEFNLPDELQRLIYTDNTGSQCLPLIKGEAVQLPYTMQPDSATFADVEWTSSNEAVATVDQEGTVSAISGDGTGFSVINVTPVGYLSSSGISASLKVVVSNELVPAQSIAISSEADELYGGDKMQLTATISPDNATYKTVEWTSSDENVATVDADGVLTAQITEESEVPVTITATALDGSGVTATKNIIVRQIVQPEQVTIDPSFNNTTWAYNEGGVTLTYTTVPEQCTTSLIQWTTSNPLVATVDNGVVTFTGRGDVTITATCPETGQSSSVTLHIPSGFVRETYSNPDRFVFASTGNGTHEWRDGHLTMITYAVNSTTQRGDLKNTENIYLNAGSYPIIAVRMEDVKDKYAAEGVTARNITLDASGDGYSGGLDGNNNKWLHDYKCSDGSHVFIYDLTQQSWANGGQMDASLEVEFRTFQFKYADIKTIDHTLEYNVYWLQTFKTLEEVQEYIAGEDLTYEVIK